MTDWDVFNGDADGICALLQLRLVEPRDARRVTGVKRDIALLERVEATGDDRVTVLDVSLDTNREALGRVLDAGAQVRYFDHHYPGEIPDSPHLHATIDPDPATCTSLLVNDALDGAQLPWAVAAAFGDNMAESARKLAETAGLDGETVDGLERLGICINYNGYGTSVDDLHFHPERLFLELLERGDPLVVIRDPDGPFAVLEAGYRDDLARADSAESVLDSAVAAAYLLPDEAWARRVSGVWGNDLANQHPGRAHAVITELDECYRISIRAPLSDRRAADEIARRWPTGGGRAAAAGINELPKADLTAFLEDLAGHWG